MLNVILDTSNNIDPEKYIFSPDTYFKYNFEAEWLEDEFVREMVLDVDKSSVISSNVIESPVLGQVAPEHLSGGVKALVIMYNEPNMIVNASACEDNCAKWILKIGRIKDLTIRLGYEMEFPEPFEMTIANSGHTIHSYIDFFDECQEVW